MRNSIKIILVMMTSLVMAASACAPAVEQAPAEEPPMEEVVEDDDVEEVPGESDTSVEARFTIGAEEALQSAIGALYAAYFDGEEAVFVEADADLLAAGPGDPALGDVQGIPAYFLPETAFVSMSGSEDVEGFIEFAISAEGVAVLVETGALPASVTVVDQGGFEVEVQMPVFRMISAHGPTTFMYYAVGARDRLVGASYLGARNPGGAAALERIDPRSSNFLSDDYFSQSEFSIEQAVQLDPQLVAVTVRTSWIETVEEIGVPVVRYEAETPELLKEAVLMTGELMGPYNHARARAWVEYYDRIVNRVIEESAALAEEDRVTVLFTGTDPLRVASGEMYQSAMIRAAGGISATDELSGYWNDVNLEQVALWNPDVIFVPPYGGANVEAITESPEWQILDAVEEGRVYQIPKLVAPWDTPTPDSVLGVIWMAQQLYPDVVTLDCEAETEYYYNTFYDYAISAEEVQTLCAID